MTVKVLHCLWYLIIVVIVICADFSEGVRAQSHVDEEIKLSQLTISAFECSVLAVDEKENKRLFDIGFEAGKTFLDGLQSLTDEENNNVSYHIAVLWNFVAGPNHDFILGRIYEGRTIDVLRGVVQGDAKTTDIRKAQEFQEKNCALIR